jgi:flagellar M-ring protein FliF
MPAQGVPGALSNQPPGPASAPFNAPQGANAGPGAGPKAGPKAGPNAEPDARAAGQGAVAAGSSRKESTVNFELDKTIRHTRSRSAASSACRWRWWSTTRRRPGRRRPAGQAHAPAAQELTQINNLVKEAMGFSQDRGDTVNVVNAAFTESKVELDIPLWKDPDNVSMAKSLLKNLIIFGLAFYLVFGVCAPFCVTWSNHRKPEKPRRRDRRHVPGEAGRRGLRRPGGGLHGSPWARCKEFTKANPKVTADIVKEWMGKE